MPYVKQYSEPSNVCKRWIYTYVRHVAHFYKHEQKPELGVTGVKFYRVMHAFLGPGNLLAGTKPNDVETYLPFYFGEYDADGKMKETCLRVNEKNGEITYRDPFLYWLIPIDYVRKHAEGRNGMIPWGDPSKGEDE
jgi:hypothetical protein